MFIASPIRFLMEILLHYELTLQSSGLVLMNNPTSLGVHLYIPHRIRLSGAIEVAKLYLPPEKKLTKMLAVSRAYRTKIAQMHGSRLASFVLQEKY